MIINNNRIKLHVQRNATNLFIQNDIRACDWVM